MRFEGVTRGEEGEGPHLGVQWRRCFFSLSRSSHMIIDHAGCGEYKDMIKCVDLLPTVVMLIFPSSSVKSELSVDHLGSSGRLIAS